MILKGLTPGHGIHGDAIIVHSKEVNHVDYAKASINEAGLRERKSH